jgi:uncharacterized protein (DUF1501 family)
MNPLTEHLHQQSRRQFFHTSGLGMGSIALANLMGQDEAQAAKKAPDDATKAFPGLPGLPHFAPKAKRVIYLFMAGAPPQIDLLDYKPTLDKIFDTDLPDTVRMGQRLTTMTSKQKRFPIAPSKYKFTQHGKSGAWFSELLSHTATQADKLAIIKSVNTEAINHDPAITYIQTGNQIPGKPSLGAWLSYGLGSVNENLPSFVVMTPRWSAKRDAQALYQRLWSTGFLASKHAGVRLRSDGAPVLYLKDSPGVDRKTRRLILDGLSDLNQQQLNAVGDPEINTRIAQYEMAFRMQTSVPELMDIAKEPASTFKLYGDEAKKPGTYAASCLLARRLVERDVRLVQIFHRGWDQHGNIGGDLPKQCKDVDQPTAGLLRDLEQRGMLDDTLVIWGGEFGRTVYCQGKLTRENYGRDHHPRNFCMWMAGAGIKSGAIHGETDDFSYNIVRDPVHIHHLNATILHLMGINHTKLSHRFQGLDQRLTSILPYDIMVKGILS